MNVIQVEGKRHSLTLRSVSEKDSGTVSFHVGSHTSFACLTVKGKLRSLKTQLASRLCGFIFLSIYISQIQFEYKSIS